MDIGLDLMNYNVVVDILIALAMGALWYLWWQQSKHRQAVEKSLMEAASQLQEATLLLDEALKQITTLKKEEYTQTDKPSIQVEKANEVVDDGIHVQISPQARDMSRQEEGVATVAQTKGKKAFTQASQSTQAAQILRMQREGEKAEDIAMRLDIPLAQVKLMLMLQGA